MKIRYMLFGAFAAASLWAAAETPQWITSADCRNEENTMICLQRVVNLDVVPDTAIARIAADSKYWLWVNGQQAVLEGGVKRGPNPHDSYYDTVDIAPYLKPGNNLISVQLWYFGKQGFSYNPSGQAAFFLDCPVAEQLNTGEGWTARLHPAYYTPAGESPNFRLPESNVGFDAQRDIPSWQSAAQQWPDAVAIGLEGDEPWGRLHYRLIPLWKDFGAKPYEWTQRKAGQGVDTIVAKLPYNAQVMPIMRIEASAGDTIGILTDHYRGGGEQNVRAEYVARDGEQQYECLGWMNGECVYYLVPKDLKIIDLAYRETGYDTEICSDFQCSDPFWERLYDKAARTLYITMRDNYMDCPDRERAQWWGDAVNESGEAFYAMSRSSDLLMKKGMYELIGWQRPDSSLYSPVPAANWDAELPGQMLASVGHYGFWNYYLNTGDLQTIADLYPGVNKYLASWPREADGKVVCREGGWQWGDWGENIDKPALYNALYYLALQGQMEMADALGLTAERDSIASERERLKAAFNKSFWTGEAYRSPSYSECTDDRVQAMAVVAALADADKYDAILRVLANCEHASPYMEKYVAEAYFIMGHGAEGLDRLRRRFELMVDDLDHTTLFEGWGIGLGGYGGGTTNHAWSGGGLTILSQYVAGISPLTPGYERFSIKPDLCGIESISLTVPTVRGDIHYSAHEANGEFTLTLEAPAGTEAEVTLPAGYARATANGAACERQLTLPGGTRWELKMEGSF